MKILAAALSVISIVFGVAVGEGHGAVNRTFGAGSLIIPMDGDVYQLPDDGGVYEAYGFIYKLLGRKDSNGDPDPIPVYWIIDDTKTSMTATDLTISDAVVNPVVTENTLTGETNITGVSSIIQYTGGPFVIDSYDAAAAKAIWVNGFADVNLHSAKIPFTAPVQREMFGTPPKIALMNDSESRTGNATKILGSYLQIAGIVNDPAKCNTDNAPVSGDGCIYDVLTPNEVGGIQTLSGTALNGQSILFDYTCSGCSSKPEANYSVLWVPHWVGYSDYLGKNGAYKSFNPTVGTMSPAVEDVHDIVMAIRDFVDDGNSLFAECASIETFEWSKYGRFLTRYDIGHDGGTNDAAFVHYNEDALDQPFVQVGSFQFEPQGGHLHNWRPFQTGDVTTSSPPTAMTFNPSSSNPKSAYNQSNTGYDGAVTVFTYDDPDFAAGTSPAPPLHNYTDGDAAVKQWHYYVGGNMDGDLTNGYVVYLGGHSYVSCDTGGGGGTGEPDHDVKLTFSKDMSTLGDLDLTIEFKVDGTTYTMTINDISAANLTTKTTTQGDLKVDFSSAAISNKEITGIHFVNLNSSDELEIKKMTGTWDVGGAKLEDVYDVTEGDNVEKKESDEYNSGEEAEMKGFKLDQATAGGGGAGAGGYDSGCTPKGTSGAGIRYVLNTVFQLDKVKDREFVRSAPVVFKDFLYQGSFDYPSFGGHLKKLQVNADLGGGKKGLKIDADFGTAGDTAPLLTTDTIYVDTNSNKVVDDAELTGRKIYASTETGLSSGLTLTNNSLIKEFKFENANLFQSLMGLSTLTSAQDVVIKRYGMQYDNNLLAWVKKDNVMGGVEHSAPAIIGPSVLTDKNRPTMVYVGALDGMIHAFKAGVNTAAELASPGEPADAGRELWSYIPSSQLPKLQYFRDPNAISTYPGVDASLAFTETPDSSGNYITVLLTTMGIGGNSILALDVTDPTRVPPKLLWERSGVADEGVGTKTVTMGNGSKVAIGKVKTKSGEVESRAFITTALKDQQGCQDANGNPLGDGTLCGGIQIYTFDLLTGVQRWRFERVYATGVNDIPGSLSLVDVDQNGIDDYVVVGDLEGNLWMIPTTPDYDGNGQEDKVIKADSTFTDAIDGFSDTITDINPLYAPSRDEAPCTTYPSNPDPCYEAGHDQPIGISPTVVTDGGLTSLVWATGGTQWSSNTDYYSLYVLDITGVNPYDLLTGSGTLKNASLTFKFVLDQGEKVFGAVTLSQGELYFATAFGSIEGLNPRDDAAATNKGNIRGVNVKNKSSNWKYTAVGKFRGSIYVSRGHVYATTLDGTIVDIGDGTFVEPSAMEWYKLKGWREIYDLNTNQ